MLEKDILKLGKIKKFRKLNYTECADICYCDNCKENMFVPTATENCPACGEELQWVADLEKKCIFDVYHLSEYMEQPNLVELI